MSFSIRIAREEDAGSIVELLNAIIRAKKYTILAEEFSLEEEVAFIRGFPERGVLHVAIADDSTKVLGIQSVEPVSSYGNALSHVGDIGTFVSLASHGKGIGRALSHATFEAARGKGFTKLTAMVRADNPGAVSFYMTQGFRVIGTAQKHARVRGEYMDEIFLEKLIG